MDAFWASLWGSLAGAVVGAAAAWLFSLDLRRRDSRDRTAEGKAEASERYERLMRRLWAEFAVEVIKYGAAEELLNAGNSGIEEWKVSHSRMLELTLEIRTSALAGDYDVFEHLHGRFAWDGYGVKSSDIAAVLTYLASRKLTTEQAISAINEIEIPAEADES